MKYVDTAVTLLEIPDEITLCINISNCPCHCKGCHSPYLADDVGEILTFSRLEKLIKQNKGITAVCLMGGDNNPKEVNYYAKLLRQLIVDQISNTYTISSTIMSPKEEILPKGSTISSYETIPMELKIGWYSGRQELAKEIDLKNFDYIKLGPYIEEKGPLNNPNTNQRLYKYDSLYSDYTIGQGWRDITYKFWNGK